MTAEEEMASCSHATLSLLASMVGGFDSLSWQLDELAGWAEDHDLAAADWLRSAAGATAMVACSRTREAIRDLAQTLPLPGLEYQP